MRYLLIKTISFYQKYLSFDQGLLPRYFGVQKKVCMYYPTCSEYMKQAIVMYGVFKGFWLGTQRIWRCNPRNEPGVDLVPEPLDQKNTKT